jgi:hypothetical protein
MKKMNLVGVEPRLSLLEAEEEGGGGGDSLWEKLGTFDITPKDGKYIFLENKDDPDIRCNFNESWIVFEGNNGKRMLSANPIESAMDVISLGDLDDSFVINPDTHLIQSLWKPYSTSAIKPLKSTVFLNDTENNETYLEPAHVEVRGEINRHLDGKYLTTGEQVISLQDLDGETLFLNRRKKIEANIPTPLWKVDEITSYITPTDSYLVNLSGDGLQAFMLKGVSGLRNRRKIEESFHSNSGC